MKLLIWMFYGYLIVRIIKYIGKCLIKRALFVKPEETKKRVQGQDMVHDQVCDTFVLKDKAIKKNMKDNTYYFCSENCLNKFIKQRK